MRYGQPGESALETRKWGQRIAVDESLFDNEWIKGELRQSVLAGAARHGTVLEDTFAIEFRSHAMCLFTEPDLPENTGMAFCSVLVVPHDAKPVVVE